MSCCFDSGKGAHFRVSSHTSLFWRRRVLHGREWAGLSGYQPMRRSRGRTPSSPHHIDKMLPVSRIQKMGGRENQCVPLTEDVFDEPRSLGHLMWTQRHLMILILIHPPTFYLLPRLRGDTQIRGFCQHTVWRCCVCIELDLSLPELCVHRLVFHIMLHLQVYMTHAGEPSSESPGARIPPPHLSSGLRTWTQVGPRPIISIFAIWTTGTLTIIHNRYKIFGRSVKMPPNVLYNKFIVYLNCLFFYQRETATSH